MFRTLLRWFGSFPLDCSIIFPRDFRFKIELRYVLMLAHYCIWIFRHHKMYKFWLYKLNFNRFTIVLLLYSIIDTYIYEFLYGNVLSSQQFFLMTHCNHDINACYVLVMDDYYKILHKWKATYAMPTCHVCQISHANCHRFVDFQNRFYIKKLIGK